MVPQEECVTNVLRICYECVTNVLRICYEYVTNVLLEMGQNIIKFDENGSKYNEIWWKSMILGQQIWFGGEKNDFRGPKMCFYDDFGVKNGNFEKKCENFRIFIFFQNFIFDQEFDSNGPGA